MFNKKYIMTPDAKPLYAMVKCCGPQMGPLKKPTPTPLEVIKDILMQANAPEIYEVIPQNNQLTKYSTPVRLTLDNYKTPYDEILAPIVAKDSSKADKDRDVYEIVSKGTSQNKADLKSRTEEKLTEHADHMTDDSYTEEEMELLRQMEEEENV